MKTVYLASPFFNTKQNYYIQLVLEKLNKNKTIGNIFLPSKHQQSNLEPGTPLWKYTVFEQDLLAINNSDIVIAIINFDKRGNEILSDPGTVYEMGYSKGINKPVILVDCEYIPGTKTQENPSLNLMVDMGSQVHLTLDKLEEYDFENLEINRLNYTAI